MNFNDGTQMSACMDGMGMGRQLGTALWRLFWKTAGGGCEVPLWPRDIQSADSGCFVSIGEESESQVVDFGCVLGLPPRKPRRLADCHLSLRFRVVIMVSTLLSGTEELAVACKSAKTGFFNRKNA